MTLLGYQEPKILEVFKNTPSYKGFTGFFFPIMDLIQVVETVKRILNKEKIDRQLAGQTSSTPFMSVKDSYNKRVMFDATDGIEPKIDKEEAKEDGSIPFLDTIIRKKQMEPLQ